MTRAHLNTSRDRYTATRYSEHRANGLGAIDAWGAAKEAWGCREYWKAFDVSDASAFENDSMQEELEDAGMNRHDTTISVDDERGVAIALSATCDEDSSWGSSNFRTSHDYFSWHSFCRGASDGFVSFAQERRHAFSFDVQSAFDDCRAYYRKTMSRHDAWLAAVKSIQTQVAEEIERPEQFYLSRAVLYRSDVDSWTTQSSDACGGCVEYGIEQWAWDNGVAEKVEEASELAAGWRAAKEFCSVD